VNRDQELKKNLLEIRVSTIPIGSI